MIISMLTISMLTNAKKSTQLYLQLCSRAVQICESIKAVFTVKEGQIISLNLFLPLMSAAFVTLSVLF